MKKIKIKSKKPEVPCWVITKTGRVCCRPSTMDNKCIEHHGYHICECRRLIYTSDRYQKYCWNCGEKIPWDKIEEANRKKRWLHFDS